MSKKHRFCTTDTGKWLTWVLAYVTWVYSSSCNNCMMTASNTIEAFYVLDAKTLHKLIYSSHRLYEVDKETDI